MIIENQPAGNGGIAAEQVARAAPDGYTMLMLVDSTVTVNPPHAYEVSREMLARKIVVDFRANAGIRIAPHFYNTDDEVRATVDVIGEILADGSWQKHTQGREFVT